MLFSIRVMISAAAEEFVTVRAQWISSSCSGSTLTAIMPYRTRIVGSPKSIHVRRMS